MIKYFIPIALLIYSTFVSSQNIGSIRDKMSKMEIDIELMQKEIQFNTIKKQWEKNQNIDSNNIEDNFILPQVVSIGKINDIEIARLRFDSGIVKTYNLGDCLNSRSCIYKITNNGVIIKKTVKINIETKNKTIQSKDDENFYLLEFYDAQISKDSNKSSATKLSNDQISSNKNGQQLNPFPQGVMPPLPYQSSNGK